ncbi:acyltransferase [Priestia megaterium]
MLNSLTSFRFIAALMVFIFHAGLLSQYQLGAAGVSFFFILSGFILTYSYQEKMNYLNKVKIKNFYIARFAKIYPVHLLTFIIALPITLIYFHPNGLYLVKLALMSAINLSLIQSFVPSQSTYFNFNGVSWTLSVEAFFYLTFPFLLWYFSRIKVSKHIGKSLGTLILIWVALFILNMNLDENKHVFVWLLHIIPVARLFEFTTGIILGLIFLSKIQKKSGLNKKLFSGLETFSLILFLGSMALSTQFDIGAVRGGFFIPIWCILIYIFAHQAGIFSRILSNKFLVYFGEISFSFYMIHQLVIRYYEYFKFEQSYMPVVSFVITMILSAIAYRYYEEPVRKRIRFGSQKKLILSNNKASTTLSRKQTF